MSIATEISVDNKMTPLDSSSQSKAASKGERRSACVDDVDMDGGEDRQRDPWPGNAQ